MQDQANPGAPSTLRKLFGGRGGLLRLSTILVVLVLSIGGFLFRDHLPSVETFGYPTIFIVSFISAASVLIPLPGVGAVCVAATVLSPLAVGVLAALGETAGEITGYIAGAQNRDIVMKAGPRYQRIRTWMERRGNLALFVLSAVPNPLFDVAGIAAGVLRFPVWRFLGIVFAGKLIKSMAFAYLCNAGVNWVQRLIG